VEKTPFKTALSLPEPSLQHDNAKTPSFFLSTARLTQDISEFDRISLKNVKKMHVLTNTVTF
jgi:hypothetical protein